MELFLIRHGEAETGSQGGEGPPLSKRGQEQIQKMLNFVVEKALRPKVLFSSPLGRAIQTAEIFNEAGEFF